MKFALFCIVLLAAANATSLMERFPMPINGRSITALMVQIEAHMKTNGPMNAITDLLNEFEKGIKDEQIAHTELAEENRTSCAEEFTFRQTAMKDAEAANKEAATTLSGCETQLARAKADKKAAENFLTVARTSLGTLERTRMSESEIYGTDQTAYSNLIKGIDEVLVMVDNLGGDSNSFVQISKHANKLILMAAEVSSVHGLSEVMTALVQMKDANTQQLILKLKGLFDGFKTDSQNKKKKSTETENAAIVHYNKSKTRLTGTIKRLEDEIEGLEGEITELEACVAMQQGIAASGKAKLTRNTNMFNSATSVCAASELSYTQQTAARKDELELLMVIKEKVKERYGEIDNEHGTIDRGNKTTAENDASYSNATDFEDKTFDAGERKYAVVTAENSGF